MIHRKLADGWRSTLDGGLVASTEAATYEDSCRDAEATIRAALGPAFVACDHHSTTGRHRWH